eukprot:9329204-Alexandrium_andersonii.AAC.1
MAPEAREAYGEKALKLEIGFEDSAKDQANAIGDQNMLGHQHTVDDQNMMGHQSETDQDSR